jgi:UDP-N-acetylmuramate--alanine ligase
LGKGIERVHFIGIGGISMSGLAEILHSDGFEVSGSDAVESDITLRLRKSGIGVAIGNKAENIPHDVDIAVYTAAVHADNPEYIAAKNLGIPVIDRARLLGMITEGYPYTVCVSGTHGKTGTTALVSEIFLAAGLDPTISIGGYMAEGYNYRIGESGYFIMEACEYFDSFLQWRPHVGVILNIDNDHMDFFGSMDRLYASFGQFAKNIKQGGSLVIYENTAGFEDIIKGLNCNIIAYGIGKEAPDAARRCKRLYAENIQFDVLGRPSFDILMDGIFVAYVKLPLTGKHQVLNALASTAAGIALGVSAEEIKSGVNFARGVKRRFEYKGDFNGADVVDDYAHHPTEIKANLSAAKDSRRCGGGRVICAFQPHTYSRTRNLLNEFSAAFDDADTVLMLPVYASREKDPGDISSMDLVERLRLKNIQTQYAPGFDEAVHWLEKELAPGDLLITMGAGDVYLVGERLLHTDFSTLSTAI